jgi:hypothetical protein
MTDESLVATPDYICKAKFLDPGNFHTGIMTALG